MGLYKLACIQALYGRHPVSHSKPGSRRSCHHPGSRGSAVPRPGAWRPVAPESDGRVRGEITTEQEGGRGPGPDMMAPLRNVMALRALQIFDQENFITFKQNIKD